MRGEKVSSSLSAALACFVRIFVFGFGGVVFPDRTSRRYFTTGEYPQTSGRGNLGIDLLRSQASICIS